MNASREPQVERSAGPGKPSGPAPGPDGSLVAADAGRARELRIARLLASLISLTFVGLGILSLVTGQYSGRTRGGAWVSLAGTPALAAGLSLVLFGLFPLALWFRSRRPALAWVVACFVGAAAAYASIHR